MAITIDGESKRIGLALSGGGFRAAAFHLGVFRKLKAMGILWDIDLLSCVSGGSVAGAFLATNWGKDDALDELHKYLNTRSIATSSALLGALSPFHSRLEILAKNYDKDLYKGGTLDSLKNGPRLYLNTTNMSTGNMFSFVAGGSDKSEMGEWDLGFADAGDFPIADAVAASSAFPPVFPPLKLSEDKYPNARVDYVTLTDGGVYDNLGVNPTARYERNKLDYVIISDGGKPFDMVHEPTESGTGVLKGAIGILMEQVRGLQFKRMELGYMADKKTKPLWFSINSEKGEVSPGDAVFASNIRTHLEKLKDAEMEILSRHAQGLLSHRIEKYAPELKSAT